MVVSQNITHLEVIATRGFSVNSPHDYSKLDAWATISIPVLYFGKSLISNVFVFYLEVKSGPYLYLYACPRDKPTRRIVDY